MDSLLNSLATYPQEHELKLVLDALRGKPLKKGLFSPYESGAVPLYKKGHYPWGAFPYPKEHAELCQALFLLKHTELATKMKLWQLRTISHTGEPLFSLFQQEGGLSQQLLRNAYAFLAGEKPCEGLFYDHECGFAGLYRPNTTIVSVASGCKSGMGLFLHEDAGIVNFGPQQLPFGECTTFGMAGRPLKMEFLQQERGYCLSYQTRLSASHPRKVALSHLQDSGFSGRWINATQSVTEKSLHLHICFEPMLALEKTAFVFFGKGEACVVAGSQKLRPKSLDRYVGTPAPLEFRGKQGRVTLHGEQGISSMEVIPLGGTDSFWGADYLVGYFLNGKEHSFSLGI